MKASQILKWLVARALALPAVGAVSASHLRGFL